MNLLSFIFRVLFYAIKRKGRQKEKIYRKEKILDIGPSYKQLAIRLYYVKHLSNQLKTKHKTKLLIV